MSKKPKDDREISESSDKKRTSEHSTWEGDIENNEYYYDDAHGYQKYVPEDEDEAELDLESPE